MSKPVWFVQRKVILKQAASSEVLFIRGSVEKLVTHETLVNDKSDVDP